MRRSPYVDLFELPGVRRLFVVAFVARLPQAMTGVVLTLHVVTTLHRGYGEAGIVTGALTIGMGLGGPWRGRLVDRLGVRRAVIPSVVVASALWFAAPHLPYPALLVAVFVAGVYLVPAFSATRQALSVLVPPARQQTAFAADSVVVEVTFMVAPLVGVLIATSVSTTVALTVVAAASVGGGALLAWANPATRSSADLGAAGATGGGRVLTPRLLVVLLAGVAAAFVLMGTDVSLVATLQNAGRAEDLGWMIALWCVGSVAGGIVYGSRGSSWSPLGLVVVLSLATVPAALASGQPWLAIAVVVAGIPCAPSLAAINSSLVRLVPEHRRGEAMGWSGTTQTIGNAIGAPLVGWMIDRSGPSAGFLTAAIVGGAVAVGGLVAAQAMRGRRAAAPDETATPPAPMATTPSAADEPATRSAADEPATRSAADETPTRSEWSETPREWSETHVSGAM